MKGRHPQRRFRFPQRQEKLRLPDLERALAEDRFSILLQPQVDLEGGAIVAVEALARLQGEHGELISPAEFVPLAERTGFIRPLGRRLFALSCEAAGRLAAAGHGDCRVAINLSAVQVADPAEMGALLEILAASGVDPRRIEVELTESAAVRSFTVVHRQLQRFRALGATVAIDDFGTGFASLSYLLELEVDRLKIDRLFIAALGRGHRSGLAETVIHLGRKLSLDVIAEGVETEEEASWLRRHHCPSAQGFLFSRPVTLERLLADWPAELPSEALAEPPLTAPSAALARPFARHSALAMAH